MEGKLGSIRSWVRGSLLGAGSFGQVNLALNAANGELFAVKSIEFCDKTKNDVKALENEMQILQDLDSPRVVKCFGGDWTVENGRSMRNVFLEYMPGGSLADLMKKFGGKLDEQLVRSYTRDILRGIDYLHSKNIVHCDIKGKNVLVGLNGVKLGDFGSAKYYDEQNEDCVAAVKGTPLWMAPEVARQEEQGPSSDIWSLGCTVLEMLTGRAPWSNIANSFVALYRIGCTDELPELPSSLSEEGKDFLQKCLCRDAKSRWTSTQLLDHPFVLQDLVLVKKAAEAEPRSPNSTLEFSDAWDSQASTLENSVPILSLKKKSLFRETESPSNSKRTSENSKIAPSFSQGKWIVVRSPQGKASIPSLFNRLSDFESIDSQQSSISKISSSDDLTSEHGSTSSMESKDLGLSGSKFQQRGGFFTTGQASGAFLIGKQGFLIRNHDTTGTGERLWQGLKELV